MEDLSSYPNGGLNEACRLLLADPNYIPSGGNDYSDDDDDDPLGQPENCFKINDDWTVSSQEHFHAVEYELNGSDEDQVEFDDRENHLLDNTFNEITQLLRRELSSSHNDEQVVPSTPKKIRKLTLAVGGESTASASEVGDEGGEVYEEEKKVQEQVREQEEEQVKNEKVPNKEIANMFKINGKPEEKPVNRSSPQPP